MISALNDGRPGAASACDWMCRRICVGGKNGCSCDSRESGWERSITRLAIYCSFPERSLQTWTIRGTTAATIRSPSSLLARVASPTTPDGGDVAEHVHRHDHARPLRAHLVAAERRPRQAGLAHRLAAIPGVARRAVGLDALAERHRERGLRLLGVDQRPLDLGEHVAGEVPPLREEDAPAGGLEVVVDRDRQRGDVAAVPVDGDEPLEAVVDERVADLAEDLEERRRREPDAPRELHVVPGERHVDRRGNEHAQRPRPPPRSAARAHSARAITQSVSSGMWWPCCSVVPIGIRTVSTPLLDRRLDLRPGHALDEALAHHGDLPRMSDIVQYSAVDWRAMEGGAGQRSRALVRRPGRGRAGRPDPRRGLRALQLRARDARARRSTSRSSTTTCAATASPTGRCRTTTWRSGPTTSPA